MKSFRVALRKWRKAKGWTQKQMAELLCTHEYSVGRWERLGDMPGPSVRRRLEELGFRVVETAMFERFKAREIDGSEFLRQMEERCKP